MAASCEVITSGVSRDQFWTAVNIFHDRPHLVNRRLYSVSCLYVGFLKEIHGNEDVETISSRFQTLVIDNLNMTELEFTNVLFKVGIEAETQNSESDSNRKTITIRKLLPRNCRVFQPCLELTIVDKKHDEVGFAAAKPAEVRDLVLAPPFPYSIRLVGDEMRLTLYGCGDVGNKSLSWLQTQLFPKLCKWSKSAATHNPGTASLALVSLCQYNLRYQQLKEKYGQEMVKVWPENTDPLKFVYEDVAIATYLLLLWEQEGHEPQSFVDLGCGNGLLVYILNSEGHRGVGLDVRKRKIWDMYPPSTKLQVCTITPSASSLFPDANWLIGNHSDELTPWIPVMAARSSATCRFFVLPCCPYEFDGSKYQRRDASRSQYNEYLEYVCSIAKTCGFETSMDKLRIPSTRRICLVGLKRHSESSTSRVDEEIQELIESRSKFKRQEPGLEANECGEKLVKQWITDFKPRDSKEVVRNCTSLDKALINEIVDSASSLLLSKKCFVTITNDEGKERLWNAGGCMMINEMAQSLPKEKLLELKNECGGLQTLLKNNHSVFLVEQGTVKLRMPTAGRELKSKKRSKGRTREVVWKSKPCWFFNNHPDSCPLDSKCTYKH